MLVLLRRLRRDPLTSLVNILGLGIALAAVLLMALHVRFESSYDTWIPDADRVHRLTLALPRPGGDHFDTGFTAGSTIRLLNADSPGVVDVARFASNRGELLRDGTAFDARLLLGEANALTFFGFTTRVGQAAEVALTAPDSIVLTESFARRLFGDQDPIGRTLSREQRLLRVTAIIPDPPGNSHLRFDAIAAEAGRDQNWASIADGSSQLMDTLFYVRLAPGADPAAMAAAVTAADASQNALDRLSAPRYNLHPVRDLHLSGNPQLSPGAASRGTLQAITLVALLVLAAALVNSTNLMTAQALRRGREVGIRKTVGAGQSRLVGTFLGEAVACTALAMLIALALAEVLAGPFADLMGGREALSLASLPVGEVAAFIIGVTVLGGLLGGLYPALVMARWRPDDVFRGRGGPAGAGWVRGLLVVGQFAVAIGLVIATVTVLRQVDHARDTMLGASPESLVVATIPAKREPGGIEWLGPAPAVIETLRAEIAAGPGIAAVSVIDGMPGRPFLPNLDLQPVAGGEAVTMLAVGVDTSAFALLGVEIVAGPGFADRPDPPVRVRPLPTAFKPGETSPGAPNPDTAPGEVVPAVLSRSGAAALGHVPAEGALGTLVRASTGDTYEIVGIAADGNLGTARDLRTAVIYPLALSSPQNLLIRLAPGDPRPALDHMDAVARRVMPDREMFREFADEMQESAYREDLRQARIFASFGGLAIVLACVGLFALTALAAARRTKEIGVRRVLGARVRDIVRLLVGEFARPVILANVIAWPAAWLLLSRWLEQFAVRVDAGWWVYPLAGAMVLTLATLTVGLHAARVAVLPPARTLRVD